MSFDEVVHKSAKSFSWYCLPFYYKHAGYLYVFYCQDRRAVPESSSSNYWLVKALYALALCGKTDKRLICISPHNGKASIARKCLV